MVGCKVFCQQRKKPMKSKEGKLKVVIMPVQFLFIIQYYFVNIRKHSPGWQEDNCNYLAEITVRFSCNFTPTNSTQLISHTNKILCVSPLNEIGLPTKMISKTKLTTP